jgi:hypothetical protein
MSDSNCHLVIEGLYTSDTAGQQVLINAIQDDPIHQASDESHKDHDVYHLSPLFTFVSMTKSSKRQASFPKHIRGLISLIIKLPRQPKPDSDSSRKRESIDGQHRPGGLAILGNLHDTADLQLSSEKGV